ncbi:Ig-like domain-containing protein [Aeromicrobium sp. NPDC092404]|uniref:Ig-like domain-containing protein n=1 Tax=Aeromicrobium sp. NPDC092404 TaxID=3154976 RepID=UPI0034360B68
MTRQPRHRKQTEQGSTRIALLVAALLAVATALGLTGFSSAAFTSTSSSTGSVSSAADWTPPTVTVQSPGTSVKGSVTLTASASDGESGIKSVAIQVQPEGASTWTTLCTDSTAPYSCSWTTTSAADGAYDIRAVATDNADYTTISDSVRTIVANNLLVTLADPGEVIKGSVSLTTTTYNPGLTISSTAVQYSVAGSGVWRTACTNTLSTSCTWNTTTVANGYYDLRSVVTVVLGGTYYSAIQSDVLVDNTAPAVTITDPGSPLSGTRTFSATATDADSGVAQVVIQYAPSGSSTYQTLCTDTDAPFTCSFDTTKLTNGTYTFRAIATDGAGTATTSSTVSNRVVDNTVSSVSVNDPGAFLSRTVTIAATASATSGVTSVRIQRAVAGGSTWTDLCTDVTAPYSCSWDTTTVPDGSYDLRAILVDGAGKTTTSAVVSGRRVDNSPVRGVDVQATNGGGTVGRLDTDDTLTYTYSEQVAPGTILAGWSGSATAVTLRLRDGNAFGLGNKGDTVDVLKGTSNVALGSVVLNQDFLKTGKTVSFNATMTASTATVGGVARTVVAVRIGSVASGNGLKTVTVAGGLVWTPSATAADLQGNKCSTAPASESGASDRDF